MRALANDRSIVIKKADKGSCVVDWDRNDYIAEEAKQLGDENIYKDINFKDKILQELADDSNKLFKSLKMKGSFTEKELKDFTIEFKKATNLGKLYLLPKIHKRFENVPGRPVISNCGIPTEKVSEFLDSQLKPVMQSSRSHIKDSGDFINKIKNISTIPKDPNLVILFYTNKKVLTEDLVKMAKFVLKNNYFEFSGKVKQQISGTAIGTKFAPPYTCIFMDEVETSFLETQEMKPSVWFRYIDDVFFIWTHGQEKLDSFFEELNRCNLFLDLKVSLSNGDFSTDLHVKYTDRHQFLHYTPSHPDHTKRSIIYSQALRISRICSNKSDFLKHLENMKSWFKVRGYPSKLIEQEMEKVKFFLNGTVVRQRDPRKGVPFVLTYHPLFKSMGKIINKNLNLLYMDDEVKKVFTPKPMISFRSARKLGSYLVRAKLYPEERTKGSF